MDWEKVRLGWFACAIAGAGFVASKPTPGDYLGPALIAVPILMGLVFLYVWIGGLLARYNSRKVPKKGGSPP